MTSKHRAQPRDESDPPRTGDGPVSANRPRSDASELLDLAQDAIIVRDADDRIAFWNAAAERTYGWTRAEAVGAVTHDLFQTRFWPSREEVLDALRRDGHWAGELVHRTRDGRELVMSSRWAARRGPHGRIEEVLEANRDITEEHRLRTAEHEASEQLQEQAVELERQTEALQELSEELEQANEELLRANETLQLAADRAQRLFSLADGLANATTLDEVAAVALREAMGAVGANAGTLALLVQREGGAPGELEFRTVRTTGYGTELGARFTRFPLTAGRPLSDAVLTRAPVLIESRREWRARYPEMAAQTDELAYEAMVNLPIIVRDEPIAGLTLSCDAPRHFDDATRTFLATVGEQCGIAIGRALAFEGERRGREATAFLADASRLLAASLDYEVTLRTVAESAVPRLADWCAVDVLLDPGARDWPPAVQRLAVVHQDPAKMAWATELAERVPQDWSAATGLPRVIRDGVTEFHPVITDEMLVAAARSPEQLALLRGLGFSSVIIVPLVARGVTLGALTLCATESGRRYDAADRDLAEALAQRAAIAVDNARLFRDAERARDTAQEANRAKSEFLATMSHELRTPLNAIGGYVELLAMGLHGPVTDPQREVLQRVQRSQRTLLSLINDVLNFARLEAGRADVDITPVPVDEVLRDVEPLVAPQLRERGLRYEMLPLDGHPVALADREKVQQILLNLVANAVKATPPGGTITVGAAARADPPGDGGAGPGTVELTVSDTGVGIAPDKQERIFEPFVQLDRKLTSGHTGTGLGLAISRDLARRMGGDLTVRSAVGKGSTFIITLPRA